MRVWMYAFWGEMRREGRDERMEVAWVRVSLSVQDLLRVGGASGREGLQRTAPRFPKCERPRRAPIPVPSCSATSMSSRSLDVDETMASGDVQGVASSCRSMTSSILASPQGASEQYM